MRVRADQKGVSLIEMMLAFVILTTFIFFGIRLFSQYQFQVNESKVLANVDQLFQAMNNFYRAQCRQALDENGTAQSSGRLDPVVVDASGSVKMTIKLKVQDDLITPGFISQTSWNPDNFIIDNTATPDDGYYIQFDRVTKSNKSPTMSVYACVGSSIPTACDSTGGAPLDGSQYSNANSVVAVWVSQVAIKFNSNITDIQRKQIMNDLNAQCISNSATTDIASCDSTNTTGDYLIWQRPVSYYTPYSSTYGMSMPYLKQFNMQYTNDPMAGLSGVTNETLNSTTTKSWYNAQNYLCGG